MSTMSARKRVNRPGQSTEKRQGRAYRRLALKAIHAGDESRAHEMLNLANYWQARAMCNRDKDNAVDGAVIVVTLDRS